MDQACGTCQHFRPQPTQRDLRTRRKGVCTHPAHRSHGVTIVIYAHETRCRRGFGDDDWTPASSTEPVLSLGRLVGPDASGAAPNAAPRDILIDERPVPLGRDRRRAFPLLPLVPAYVDRDEVVAD